MAVSTETASLFVSGASVIFAAALTVVTYWYYVETKRQTDEMEATREAEFKPVITPTLTIQGAMGVFFAFENTGKGAAHDVTASWKFRHQDEDKIWKSSLVSPDERHRFFLPFDEDSIIVNIHKVIENLGDDVDLVFEATYRDSLGNLHETNTVLDIQDNLEDRVDSGEATEKDDMTKIIDELKDIDRRLDELGNSIEDNNLTKLELSKRILELLESQDRMTVGEIKSILPLNNRAVERQLSSLSDSDMVELEGDEPSVFNSDTTIYLLDS